MLNAVQATERALQRALAWRWAPVAAGAITAAAVTLFWGGLDVPAFIHDERSYLVQARLLAQGMWSAPSPPLPAFWEMAHVFVEPGVFSKYPPGHAPLLVPGVWLGFEGLMPVLLAGLAGGLLFALARRCFGGSVALLGWGIWTSSPFVLRWQASYFSESTTTVLWLLALLCLVAWRERERPWLLVGLTACVAWLGITRPFTALALGVPLLAAVVSTARARRSLNGWLRSAVTGVLVLAIIPLWGLRTLGSATAVPYIEYSRWYFPFERPGFTQADSPPPLRALPADLELLSQSAIRNYDGHTVARVPAELARRAGESLRHAVGAAAPLLPVALAGLWFAGAGMATFAVASFGLLIGVYLLMPQPVGWSLYSAETFAIAPVLLALGLVRGTRTLAERRRGVAPPLAVLAASAVLCVAALQRAGTLELRASQEARRERLVALDRLLAALPESRRVIFVRRTRPMPVHTTLWDILGPPATTDTWIVRDLGDAQNAALIAEAGDRRPYLLDEVTMTLTPYQAMP